MSHLIFLFTLFSFGDVQISDKITLHGNSEQVSILSFNICNESIYTLDKHKKIISKYALDGSFIKLRLADGRGPGEFDNMPGRIHCLESGDLLILETNLFHYFDKDLNHIKTELFEPMRHMGMYGIVSILAEYEDYYLANFSITANFPKRQYLKISKDGLGIIDSFGFEPFSKNYLLERSSSTYQNGIIVTVYGLTGQIVVFNVESKEYITFKIQTETSVRDLEKRVPDRLFPGDNRFIELLEEGPVVQGYFLINDKIYLIQNKYSKAPLSKIDVYALDGTYQKSYPLPENVSRISVINNQLFGFRSYDMDIFKITLN